MFIPCEPRPLSPDEKALLEFVLSADFPGCVELRNQVELVEVVGTCKCGCGTLDFQINGDAVRSTARSPIPAEADSDSPPLNVLIFLQYGLLSSLELVFYDDRKPRLFPKPSELKLIVRSRRGSDESNPA